MASLRLKAPLSGWLVPLELVPDPVFSQKIVGDGVSLDPTSSVLLAPCDAMLVQLHAAGHALTLAAGGVEIMIHVGLDTVALKGRGFRPRVAGGQRVREGEALVEFDPDLVAREARSLLTQIVVAGGERVARLRAATGAVTAAVDVVLEIELTTGEAASPAASGARHSRRVVLPLTHGLHARPAALVAGAARRFGCDVRLRRGPGQANAKSVISLLALEADHGDELELEAVGGDAEAAVGALAELIESGLVEPGGASRPAPVATAIARRPGSDGRDLLVGVPASAGLAVGCVVQMRAEALDTAESPARPHEERRRLESALARAEAQLVALETRLRAETDADKAAIFGAHRELLADPELVDAAIQAIDTGRGAAAAWRAAVEAQAERLAALDSELLAGRAHDLRDVGRRVLRLITGAAAPTPPLPAETILVAEELTPSDTAALDRRQVLGLCTTSGGATSHAAILARSFDLPAVAGIDPRALSVPNGTPAVLDGDQGTLHVNPAPETIRAARESQRRMAARRAAEQARAHEPARTRDGQPVAVLGNVANAAEVAAVRGAGGDGVGLLRTEFLFLGRDSEPDEDEQAAAYSEAAQALGHERPLVIRTLDVGGDKPLTWLPQPPEDNPFLGRRGIRLLLEHPELLRAQLRAVLRASRAGRVAVMFPMVATLAEFRAARAQLEAERAALGVAPIAAGIMVEVPAAALAAEAFAQEADFFSIGTNDLTQYTLAVDRGHPALAAQADALHPAVLRLIQQTVEAAHRHARRVAVCGGVAADPHAVPLLLGLGVDELSVAAPAIAAVKAQVRRLDLAECRALAARALTLAGAAEVRALEPADRS